MCTRVCAAWRSFCLPVVQHHRRRPNPKFKSIFHFVQWNFFACNNVSTCSGCPFVFGFIILTAHSCRSVLLLLLLLVHAVFPSSLWSTTLILMWYAHHSFIHFERERERSNEYKILLHSHIYQTNVYLFSTRDVRCEHLKNAIRDQSNPLVKWRKRNEDLSTIKKNGQQNTIFFLLLFSLSPHSLSLSWYQFHSIVEHQKPFLFSLPSNKFHSLVCCFDWVHRFIFDGVHVAPNEMTVCSVQINCDRFFLFGKLTDAMDQIEIRANGYSPIKTAKPNSSVSSIPCLAKCRHVCV